MVASLCLLNVTWAAEVVLGWVIEATKLIATGWNRVVKHLLYITKCTFKTWLLCSKHSKILSLIELWETRQCETHQWVWACALELHLINCHTENTLLPNWHPALPVSHRDDTDTRGGSWNIHDQMHYWLGSAEIETTWRDERMEGWGGGKEKRRLQVLQNIWESLKWTLCLLRYDVLFSFNYFKIKKFYIKNLEPSNMFSN